MDDTPNFPDLAHLEQIRKRLWCGREPGQAAVMIGSGFSRNAEPIAPPTATFPTWGDIAGVLYKEMYPPPPQPDADYERRLAQATAGTGALRVASEYETVFGRARLDELLLRSIPDGAYRPGRLHELLLNLPWSDVFTTNYDTLLERTRSAVYQRAYDLVLTASDLPTTRRPRIVKLHGSFPSHRPFITTEEDYRTYPERFAPFVNTVQQAIMENVFCLLGFSGDDPNFLYWSGWVRDHLGSHHPPIYLCGLLQLSPSQRRLLESRNVIPIDLTPLFLAAKWPEAPLRHRKALECLLLALLRGRPLDASGWPTVVHPGKRQYASLSSPPFPTEPTSRAGLRWPDFSKIPIAKEESSSLLDRLTATREAYPGWMVAPQANRDALWRDVIEWLHPVLLSLSEMAPDQALFIARELNWCLETTLVALWPAVTGQVAPLLEHFNPYPGFLHIQGATILPKVSEYSALDWGRVGECWVELTFAVARAKREAADAEGFNGYMTRLQPVVHLRDDWQARWHHERALMRRQRLDRRGLFQVLQQWPERPDLPFWEARRAALLAEIGELRDAKRIAEAALARVRAAARPDAADYAVHSQEAWIRLLVELIVDFDRRDEGDKSERYGDHREQLQRIGCDPQAEFEQLAVMLDRPPPVPKPWQEDVVGFDPGTHLRTRHLTSEPGITPFRPAYALIRLFEVGAIPMRAGAVTVSRQAVESAVKWIAPFGHAHAVSVLVRLGSDVAIADLLDRVRVATLPATEIPMLDEMLTSALEQALQTADPDDALLRVLTEALSRICFRFPVGRLQATLSLAQRLYNHPAVRDNAFLHSKLGDLFRRTLLALPQAELAECVGELLRLPIPYEGGFTVQLRGPDWVTWPEPFEHVEWADPPPSGEQIRKPDWTVPIANLIHIVEHGPADARGRAVLRLDRLAEIDGLTDAEREAFRRALWSRTDGNSGLPADTRMLPFVFLALPLPGRDARQRVREFVLSTKFPRVVNRSLAEDGTVRKSVTMSNAIQNYLAEWRGVTAGPQWSPAENRARIDWSSFEARQLLDEAIVWWQEEREELGGSFDEYVRRAFVALVIQLAEVILPRLAAASVDTKRLAADLLQKIHDAGVITLRAMPLTLILGDTSVDHVATRLREAIVSSDENEVREAIHGMLHWLLHSGAGGIKSLSPPPQDLVDELVNRVMARRQPGLDAALRALRLLCARMPSLLSDAQLDALLIGLGYLLKETSLPDEAMLAATQGVFQSIPAAQLPQYRALAAALARELSTVLELRGRPPSTILDGWREACRNDPLPEVRRVWS